MSLYQLGSGVLLQNSLMSNVGNGDWSSALKADIKNLAGTDTSAISNIELHGLACAAPRMATDNTKAFK